MTLNSCLLMGALLPLAACSAATSTDSPGPPAIVIDGARIWDGTGSAPIEDGVVVLRGDRIEAVGARSAVSIPAGATLIDARGKTAIPGLINAHGHVGWTRRLVESNQNYTKEHIVEQLQQYARFGVTTVMSLGLDSTPMFEVRAAAQDAPRAAVLTAGKGFTGKGGYPGTLPQFAGVPYEVDNVEDVKARVQELADQKVDMVKIWVDDHFGRYPKIRPEIAKAIIEEGHRHNLKVVAHIFYLDDAKALVEAGIDGLVHSVRDKPVDDALIQMMKDKGTFLAATLTREMAMLAYAEPPEFLDDPFLTRLADPEDIKALKDPAWGTKVKTGPDYPKLKAPLSLAQSNFKKLFDAGVKVALGTDTGPPARFQGYFEHVEIAMMADLGLTPAQALQVATLNAAEVLGIGQETGSLEKGKRADVLLLDADPAENILNTRKIHRIWAAGREVN
jgi:imidazolonepropionase-like amidohydrolase